MYRDVSRVRKTKEYDNYIEDGFDDAAIKNSIRNILSVPVGTLPGDPEFGSRLHEVIFQPLDGLTKKLQYSFIAEALYKYEKRVKIMDARIEEIPEFNRLVIHLDFKYVDLETGETIATHQSIPFDLT